MNKQNKNIILIIVLFAVVGAIWYLESQKPPVLPAVEIGLPTIDTVSTSSPQTNSTSTPKVDRSAILKSKAAKYPRAKELASIQGYINTPKFKLADLVGKKVILVDFWTYSCINCLRTIPYLNTWYQKYKDDGFVIVGVHTPEFDFEKDYNNVAKAVADNNIKYPVVLDSNYGTWNAYANQYWPHEFLIDIDGFIVDDKIGEGDYDKTEQAIQKALVERTQVLGDNLKISTSLSVPNQDDIEAGSPETYFGAARNQYLGNAMPGQAGHQSFTEPTTINPNTLYLVGNWNIVNEYAESAGVDKVEYDYNAKGIYFVAGSSGAPIMIEVQRDGKPVDPSVKGSDIFYQNGRSYITVQGNKLYKLVDDSVAGEHTIQLMIPSAGLQAFTFTFG